ncbi:MAG: cytochrome-c peroxidase [Ignavibacteria bacterium]|nr:cytochrome-c peroxidase [Ignavibacteria bacterium]
MACSEKKTEDTPTLLVKNLYVNSVIELDSIVSKLQRAQIENESEIVLQKLFFSARAAYKRVEHFAEYYNPATARSLNGAVLEKVEEDDVNRTIEPEGFQVVEELLFPHINTTQRTNLRHQINVLASNVRRLRKVAETIELTDSHIFDALRLQIIRINTLGIVGFDTPITFHSLKESAVSLEAIQKTLEIYVSNETQTPFKLLNNEFERAQVFLRNANNFDEFDRSEFNVQHAKPLLKSINDVQTSLKIPYKNDLRAFSSNAISLFDSSAWNVEFFSPNYARPLTEAKISLGKILFYDPILSKNSDRACASCHQSERAFTDGLPTSRVLDGAKGMLRNAPTMLFAGMQNSAFYDQHVTYLEDQATGVITNENEMHGSLTEVVARLKSSKEYVEMFRQAFHKSGDSAITELHIRIALASFVRSLRPMNSPFDRFMRGETSAISSEAKHGFTIFSGKAKCATCHFTPFFNGNVPPHFTETEAEVIGVPAHPDTANATIDNDAGKYNYSKAEIEKHAFKTPTLRNIALTAPYMHNGVYSTLEQVIDFYNRGGGNGIGMSLNNQTLPADKLQLRPDEKQALIAFLRTLTDTTGITSRPRLLPKIPGKRENVRRVGGIY